MKVYTISKKSFEYNDEYYSNEGRLAGKGPVSCFRDKANAQAEKEKLDAAERQKYDEHSFEGGEFPKEFFVVNEIEIQDSQIETYSESKKKLEEAKSNMRSLARDHFATEAEKIFVKHPTLEAISVVAYTPYFADGDPCEFGIHDPQIKVAGLTEADKSLLYVDEDGFFETWNSDKVDKEISNISISAKKFIFEDISEDDFKEIFGDGVKVIITKNGIEVKEYEHD